ncbi:zinc metallopeptidase [Evansella sp. AB-rgal1]|uniref:zinc metallopeptidase n=1 Tax=Evansella sp. AB-rgal1 TaxID=3242696 RepID=UPI00359D344C
MKVDLNIEPWFTARQLLNLNNFSNAGLKHSREFNEFRLGINKDNSWCDYQPNATTTVYLKPESYENKVEEQIAVACHEVGHAINYRSGKTMIGFLKFFTRAHALLFVPYLILAALCPWTLDFAPTYFTFSVFLFLIILALMLPYHFIYKRDEVNAWVKGKEIFESLIKTGTASQVVISSQSSIESIIDKRIANSRKINGTLLVVLGIIFLIVSTIIRMLFVNFCI